MIRTLHGVKVLACKVIAQPLKPALTIDLKTVTITCNICSNHYQKSINYKHQKHYQITRDIILGPHKGETETLLKNIMA